jgi:glycosyltransferase involved in cell wall biosynthesis
MQRIRGSAAEMQVLLDTTVYKRSPSGGGLRYLDELVDRLPLQAGVSVYLLPYQKCPPNVSNGIVPPLTEPNASRAENGSQRSAAITALKNALHPAKLMLKRAYCQFGYLHTRNTIFHSTFHHRFAPYRVPMVATIVDMIYEIFTDTYGGPIWDEERRAKAIAARNAVRCIAISERTKSDLCRIYEISPEKVDVVYLGVNPCDFNQNRAAGEDEFIRQAGLSGVPYLLYVGGRANHKNFDFVLRAYAQSAICKDFALVATGSPWTHEEEQQIERLGVKGRVRQLVNPCTSQLAALYRNAAVFVFPSLYEGFGLPIIEAMACGAPVALSNGGPLPEVGGDAAEYFDPRDEQSMTKAIEVLLDPSEAARRRRQGFKRARLFSWERTVNLTVESYRKALGIN